MISDTVSKTYCEIKKYIFANCMYLQGQKGGFLLNCSLLCSRVLTTRILLQPSQTESIYVLLLWWLLFTQSTGIMKNNPHTQRFPLPSPDSLLSLQSGDFDLGSSFSISWTLIAASIFLTCSLDNLLTQVPAWGECFVNSALGSFLQLRSG